jgi:hypothetical protein
VTLVVFPRCLIGRWQAQNETPSDEQRLGAHHAISAELVWSGAVPEERVEHLPHRFWVAAQIAAEASTLRAASRCCQASVNPALRAS